MVRHKAGTRSSSIPETPVCCGRSRHFLPMMLLNRWRTERQSPRTCVTYRYGLALMNRWAREGGNPFADATWDQAWKTSRVDDSEWRSIRHDLQQETSHWLEVLGSRALPQRWSWRA